LWQPFTSSSKIIDVAKNFADGPNGIIFKIKSVQSMFANAQVGFEKTQNFILVSKERRIHYCSGVVGLPIEFGGRLLEHESQLYSKQLQSSQDSTQECIDSSSTCFQGDGRGV
jgi:hypothetical protein